MDPKCAFRHIKFLDITPFPVRKRIVESSESSSSGTESEEETRAKTKPAIKSSASTTLRELGGRRKKETWTTINSTNPKKKKPAPPPLIDRPIRSQNARQVARFNFEEFPPKEKRKAREKSSGGGNADESDKSSKKPRKTVNLRDLFDWNPTREFESQIATDYRSKAEGSSLATLDVENFPFDRRQFSNFQTNDQKAEEYLRKVLEIPTLADRKAIERKLKGKWGEKVAKENLKEYLAEAQEHLEREKEYLQVEKVQRLAFVPFDTDSNDETEEGKLKGQYRILVGDKQEMAADSGWVERNFRPEALAIVQRVGCQIKEKIRVRNPKEINQEIRELIKGDQKWPDYSWQSVDGKMVKTANPRREEDGKEEIPDKKEIDGFVDVAEEGVSVELDKRVVNKLRYFPPNKKPHPDGRFQRDQKTGKIARDPNTGEQLINKETSIVIKEHSWWGYNNSTRTTFRLNDDFVSKNFSKTLIDHIKHVGEHAKNMLAGYVQVPPGDSRQSTITTKGLKTSSSFLPKIHYRQKEGERTCLIFSFCSALHYLGDCQFASNLKQSCQKIIERPDTMKLFLQKLLGLDGKFRNEIVDVESWDILGVGYDELVIAQLRGNDGKEDHVITIARRMVFDSNMVHALPLARETLDICCRSDENETDIFEKVVHMQ